MDAPGGLPPGPSQYSTPARPAGPDDAKRRRLDHEGQPHAPMPSMGLPGMGMPQQFPFPGMQPRMMHGMPTHAAQESQMVSKMRADLDILRGHLNALKQENTALKDGGGTFEARFQESYQKLLEENERCRADFVALKAQLESSSKELNQTMEQMEQSRKDVESAVEGYRNEAKDFASAAAVDQLQGQVAELFSQAQADSQRAIEGWVKVLEGRIAEMKREAEAQVAQSRVQVQASIEQLLEEKALAVKRDLVRIVGGEELPAEQLGAMLLEAPDDVAAAHLEPIRKEIRALLADRLTTIKADLLDSCTEQLEEKRRAVAAELERVRQEMQRMEAVKGELDGLTSLRCRADDLTVMRADLDTLLADRAKLFTPDDALLTLARSRDLLEEAARATEEAKAKGEDCLKECRDRMQALREEWGKEHKDELEEQRKKLAEHNKEWCDDFMTKLAAESYENLRRWGEALQRTVTTKQDDCLNSCKAVHRGWVEEYRGELSRFKQDIVRSNKEWGQDYMQQVAAMCDQRVVAGAARSAGPAPTPPLPSPGGPAPPLTAWQPPATFGAQAPMAAPPPPLMPQPLYGVAAPMGQPPVSPMPPGPFSPAPYPNASGALQGSRW